jgi:hypothetical protein
MAHYYLLLFFIFSGTLSIIWIVKSFRSFTIDQDQEKNLLKEIVEDIKSIKKQIDNLKNKS